MVELSEKFFTDISDSKSQLERLIETINQLSSTSHHKLIILVYEYELLKSTGFGLQVFDCLNCSRNLKKSSNYFSYFNNGFYCLNCLKEASPSEELIKFTVEDQIVFRSIERRDYVGISKLDVSDVLLKKLSDCLKKSISNILGVQLKSSRFL